MGKGAEGERGAAGPSCSVDGCGQPRSAKGLCSRHDLRLWRTGSTGDRDCGKGGTVCRIEACAAPAKARGLCNRHYLRWRRHGDPEADGRARDRRTFCSVAGCGREAAAHGLCRAHDERAQAGLPLEPPIRPHPVRWRGEPCRVAGCERPINARGLCRKHYAAARRRAIPFPAPAESSTTRPPG